MMTLFLYLALILSVCNVVASQNTELARAISSHANLSGFQKFLNSSSSADAFNSILPSGTSGITVLVPTNAALDKFYSKTGGRFEDLPWGRLTAILRYHTFAAKLTGSNFTSAQGGLAIPTLLKDSAYNNRTAGAALISQFGAAAAQGNVVFVSAGGLSPAKFRIRQNDATAANLHGGLGSDATMTAVDGLWAMGNYQIIDGILEPPAPCSKTVRALSASLQSLDTALNRSKSWAEIDSAANVTCLVPNNSAFKAAGNPEITLNWTDIEDAGLYYTLPEVTYSNFLKDGDVFTPLEGGNIKVTIVNNDIYFNDVKVVSPNVLTNNGLIHVLDRIISRNGTASTPTPSSTPTTSAPPSPTKSPNASRRIVSQDGVWMAMVGFVAVRLLLI
ncbi:hypothetical protein RB595_000304 [Gaeumannomyces hyphopodioides]